METSNPMLRRESAMSESWTQTEPMTLQGTVNKAGILLLLCMGSAAFAWSQPALRTPLMLVGVIGGFIACLVGTFKPTTSPIAGPIYALLEGLALGAISQMINLAYPGIVVNAMLLTFGVLGLMLVLYTTRIVVVTDRFANEGLQGVHHDSVSRWRMVRTGRACWPEWRCPS